MSLLSTPGRISATYQEFIVIKAKALRQNYTNLYPKYYELILPTLILGVITNTCWD